MMVKVIHISYIAVQFVQHENKRFHKECFNIDMRCGKCNKPVFGNVIAALNKNWYVIFVLVFFVLLSFFAW